MNARPTEGPSRSSHLESEHQKILAAANRIHSSFFFHNVPAAEQTDAELPRRFLDQLGELRDRLQRFFDAEDAEACRGESLSRVPSLCAALAELESERADLLEHLYGLIRSVREKGLSDHTALEIEREFNEFVEILYDHDRKNNHFLQPRLTPQLGIES